MTLIESLSFFSASPIGETFVPLQSCQQVANPTELNSRFQTICSISIDWIIYRTERFTVDHATYLSEGQASSKTILFDKKASPINEVSSFIRFLINYFYIALYNIVKKVSYSINRLCVTIFRTLQLDMKWVNVF